MWEVWEVWVVAVILGVVGVKVREGEIVILAMLCCVGTLFSVK